MPHGSGSTFRIGINIGDIIIDGDDIFGDGVNIAARIEEEREPGGVCISEMLSGTSGADADCLRGYGRETAEEY